MLLALGLSSDGLLSKVLGLPGRLSWIVYPDDPAIHKCSAWKPMIAQVNGTAVAAVISVTSGHQSADRTNVAPYTCIFH